MRDSLTLLLNEGFRVGSLTGSGVAGFTERVEQGTRRIVVRFDPSFGEGHATRLEIAYAGVPTFGADSINGLSDRWVELGLDSFWHPVISDFGSQITGRVHLALPRGWRLAASGAIESRGDTLVLTNTVPLIDIAFTASPALAYTERGAVRVYYQSRPPAALDLVIDVASACTAWLDSQFGDSRRLPATRLVYAPRQGPGYARKNYIVITTLGDTGRIAHERFICHELAHFWSTGAISSGPENWLNEAFAEYVAGRYVRHAHGDEVYARTMLARWKEGSSNAGPIWTPTSTRRPTARAAYNKAPVLLNDLETRVGREVMAKIVAGFMVSDARTTPQLIDLIARLAGADTATWFREQLASR